MRAVVQDTYGEPDSLRLEERATPRVADDEVLVRVRAASVHPDVWHAVTGRPAVLRLMGNGLRRPKNPVPGTDLAGVVEAVGGTVTRFHVGDEVFGETLRGMQWCNGGAYAELATAPEAALAAKPAEVSFEEAACVPTAGLIVLFNLPDSIGRGSRVLVNGAAGGVGSLAVQIAKARGATVVGVDLGDRVDLALRAGADTVIDAGSVDFTRTGDRYDVIIDIPGNHRFSECRRALTSDGVYVLIGHDAFGAHGGRWLGSLRRFAGLLVRTPFSRHLRPSFSAPPKPESMAVLQDLLERGLIAPEIDRTFGLDRAGDALQHLAAGRARGRVVLVP